MEGDMAVVLQSETSLSGLPTIRPLELQLLHWNPFLKLTGPVQNDLESRAERLARHRWSGGGGHGHKLPSVRHRVVIPVELEAEEVSDRQRGLTAERWKRLGRNSHR